MNRPVVLTIGGLDPSGGAGVLADVRTIAAFGCFPTAAITSITYQNTIGVFGSVHQSPEVLFSQIGPIIDDCAITAVKTGMLPTSEIVEAVATLVRLKKIPSPVVDPVILSTSGHDLIDSAALALLKSDLIPRARLVTPNIPEAERLTGIEIDDEANMENAAKVIRDFGASAVLVKGGHRATQNELNGAFEAVDVLVDENGEVSFYRSDFVSVGEVHGSGCTLSAAIAACLANGLNLKESVGEAKQFVTEAIRSSQQIGRGARPLFGVR